MVRRQIELDEDTDRRPTELASEYEGDLNLALTDLVLARDGLGDFVEQSEEVHGNTLRALRDQAEADFQENRTVTWGEVKARNGL
jgi:hypothetical protein